MEEEHSTEQLRKKEREIDKSLKYASDELQRIRTLIHDEPDNAELLKRERQLLNYILWLQKELELIIKTKVRIIDSKSDDEHYLEFPLEKEPVRKGLVNVVVDETDICYINPEEGLLYYRGYDIAELVEYCEFEEVSFLLLFGKLPSDMELSYFKEKLKEESSIPDQVLTNLKNFPRKATRIELLRSALSTLSIFEEGPLEGPISEIDNIMRGIRIMAKAASLVAYSYQIATNQPFRDPHKDLSYAENFLYMINGRMPTKEEAKLMNAILILHAEHDLNASAFASRVTVSTQSDLYSGIVSAIGALKGPLHGGANKEVITTFLNEIKRVDNIEPWLDKKLANKEKIMGFGHRVYRRHDPRAVILKKLAKNLFGEGPTNDEVDNLYTMATTLESLMFKKKKLYPNVDFYSAIVMYKLGIPIDLFVHIFAISRMAGWIAHSIEQMMENKLIRPRLRYIGELKRLKKEES